MTNLPKHGITVQQTQSLDTCTRAIKAALREAFPKTRFSVTRGGAWIKWTDDGPTVEQVQTTLIAANCVKVTTSWNGQQYFEAPGNSNSIWFDCFNVAKRAADQADMARRIEEGEARRQRENEAVHAALQTKKAALARPSSDPKPIETAPETFQVFEQLRQRAERDVSTDAENNAERQRRPSCAWPLIISGEMLDICLELKLLKAGDPPIVRCWATFADPKKRGTVLREQRSSHPLIGIECRGFQLHAGAERGATSDILFEAQRDKDGTWRFGPRIHVYDYHSIHASKWESKVREREKIQSGFYNLAPDSARASLELIDKEIAEIDALDKAAAAKFYRRQQLQIRVVELARDRLLDFAGAPGVQMAMASRLCGFLLQLRQGADRSDLAGKGNRSGLPAWQNRVDMDRSRLRRRHRPHRLQNRHAGGFRHRDAGGRAPAVSDAAEAFSNR